MAITPQTLNYLGANSTYEQSGYVATIGDVRTMSTFTGVGINTPEATQLNATSTVGTNVSKTVIGTTINFNRIFNMFLWFFMSWFMLYC